MGMPTPVEQIKERLNIADVVGGYIKLERAGASLKAKCPFHSERTPSFFVSPARGSYYCFGCGAKGDMFTFVEQFEGLDFVGALRVLAARAGVELRGTDPKVRSEHARLYLMLEKATRMFEDELAQNPEALAYLGSRGLAEETVKSFRLGFARNDWRTLFDQLTKEGFSAAELQKVGLAKRPAKTAESGSPDPVAAGFREEGRYYDVFRGRVMFPITDSAGRVIAFSGRILPSLDDKKTGKYINSPETALFNKSQVLYGFDRAKLPIRQRDGSILVEGQMDLLMAHQAGFANTVASSGTALTKSHLERLKRLSDNLLVSFDADSAGQQAAFRAIILALSMGMNVRVISLSEGKDPADLIAKHPAAWKQAVEDASHAIEFALSRVLASSSGRELAVAVEKRILPLIKLLPSPVERAHFVKSAAEQTGLREETLWSALQRAAAPREEEAAAPARPLKKPASRGDALFRRVFALLFFSRTLPNSSALTARVEEALAALGAERVAEQTGMFEPERETLLLEAELLYGSGPPAEREVQELLANLEEEELSARLADHLGRLARAERTEQNRAVIGALLAECKQLSERLASLKAARFAK